MADNIPTITFESYQELSQELAVLEKFRQIGSGVSDAIMSFMTKARSFIDSKSLTESSTPTKQTFYFKKLTDSPVGKYLAVVPYTDVRRLTAFTPIGFEGSMVDYVAVLQGQMDYYVSLNENVLIPAKEYLARCVTKPQTLGGATAPKFTAETADRFAKEVGSYFGNNIATDIQPFGNVYKSNTEYLDAHVKAILLNEDVDKIPEMRAVRENVKELVSLFDKLILKITATPDIYKVNGVNAKGLTDLSYALARSVEMYSVYNSYVNDVLVAMKKTEDKFLLIAREQKIK